MPGLYDTFLDDIGPAAPNPAQKPTRRTLLPADLVPQPAAEALADVRAALPERLWEYVRREITTTKLLVAPPPGVGKTFAAVHVAERAALAGMRVAYVMLRHDTFLDIQAASQALGGRPDLWFHWLPRHADHNQHGAPNCHWAGQITTWAQRGNASMKFCASICGHHYIAAGCGYHQQERDARRVIDGAPQIIAIQHNHVSTNHPLLAECDLVIGDESPLMSFCRPWTIPPAGFQMERPHAGCSQETAALWALTARLRKLMTPDQSLEGDALYHALGGASAIGSLLAACPTKDHPAPWTAEEPETMPWQWHTAAIPVMAREIKAMRLGEPWMPRIRVDQDGMHVLLRRELSPDMPAKVIWLDATANVEMYRAVTRWPIEVHAPRVALQGPVYQVWDTLNTKAMALTADNQATERSKERARIVLEIIRRQGYCRPLVVTYRSLVETFGRLGIEATYFYANRGSNRYQDCDAVIIYGTPQLPQSALERAGQMLYSERMAPFRLEYADQPQPYGGQPFAYPTPGYWDEPHIQGLLTMIREDEIEQSAHRVRPVSTPKPIWLLTGIPVPNLPVSVLMTTLDVLLFDLPAARREQLLAMRLDPVRLCDAIDVATLEIADKSYVTHFDLAMQLAIDERTARKYLEAIRIYDPERFPVLDILAAGPGPM